MNTFDATTRGRSGARDWTAVVAALPLTGTCDLTTVGRKSGQERTVEIWYVVHDGLVHITGTPGPRDWHANLRSEPAARVVLRGVDGASTRFDMRADLLTDQDERARLADAAWRIQPWYADQGDTRDEWIAAAPMVVLRPASVEGRDG